MWEIYEHRRAVRQIDRVPVEIIKRYEKWKDIVRLSGPAGLRAIRGFRDEALAGRRKGQRSSRLGSQYRVIYTVDKDRVLVQVLEVNPHEY